MDMASAQNEIGRLEDASMVLAASTKVFFLLITTPFYCSVLVVEKF